MTSLILTVPFVFFFSFVRNTEMSTSDSFRRPFACLVRIYKVLVQSFASAKHSFRLVIKAMIRKCP